MADPVAGVTAGVLCGILLLVLLGIGVYFLWRRMCPRRHYEEFIPPTTNPPTSCQFVKPCFMTPMTPCVMPVSLHPQAIQDELTPHKEMMRGASFGDMSAFPLGSLNPGLYKCQQDEQDGDVPFPVDKSSRLCFMLEYRLSSEQLLVSLVKATNLPPVCESYPVLLKLCLLPGDRRHQQSKSKRRSCNPVFNENYVFQVSSKILPQRTLQISLFIIDKQKRHQPIGYINYDMKDMAEGTLLWKDLEGGIMETSSDIQELQASLNYNENLQRLTVVVLRARNLHLSGTKEEIILKVCLQGHDEMVKTKKTSVKKGEPFLIFNEKFSFQLPPSRLDRTCLCLSVYEGICFVGCVLLGPYMYARGKELDHWTDMISKPKELVKEWHILRKTAESQGSF
uniref:Synaptotagmin-15-like n=1 Tax=Erpetoichthys calabaricus TaxID=27687 RepID=A0A8C4X915_ERPCA